MALKPPPPQNDSASERERYNAALAEMQSNPAAFNISPLPTPGPDGKTVTEGPGNVPVDTGEAAQQSIKRRGRPPKADSAQ